MIREYAIIFITIKRLTHIPHLYEKRHVLGRQFTKIALAALILSTS